MSRDSSTCRWQGRCKTNGSVTRLAAIAVVGFSASGCFYTDPINQRPSADIIPATSDALHRGETIELDASTNDPEGQSVYVQWRAYACTDATTPAGCDPAPFYTGVLPAAVFTIPVDRADGTTPVEALRVLLEATDDRGATAKPPQELLMAVIDAAPDITMRKDSRHGYVVGTPINLFASIGDADDGAAAVVNNTAHPVKWDVFTPPNQPAVTLDPLTVTQDVPNHIVQGKVFTPQGTGEFMIQVTATDPVGLSYTTMPPLSVTVYPDHAPCLQQWSPAAPPMGSTLPINAATLFDVLVVNDDLDPYPAVAGDPVDGQTEFSWSLLPPGATQRQPLAIVGNGVAIDPASYTPGDVLELRVEIQDRNHTPVGCPDTDATCSVISDNTCIQRLTWRIEVQ